MCMNLGEATDRHSCEEFKSPFSIVTEYMLSNVFFCSGDLPQIVSSALQENCN